MRCHITKIFCLACFLLLMPVPGCKNDTVPDGVVAMVNGEPVFLRSLQSLIDSRAPSAGIPPRPSVEEMQASYSRALNTLIANTLARQELKARDMEVEADEVDAAIQEIREDYGPDGLDNFLMGASINAEDWRALMRDHLSLEKFRDEVLLPGIHVNLDEIRAYYREHEQDFKMPDNLRVCFLAAASPQAITSWCADIDARKVAADIDVQCLYAGANELPQPWQDEARKMKPGSCLAPREENGEWHSLALLEKNTGRLLNMAEAYAFIEKLLIEQKRQDAFDSWLDKKISAASIVVAPEMKPAFGGANEGQNSDAQKDDAASPGAGNQD